MEDKEVISTMMTGGLALGSIVLVFLGFAFRELNELLAGPNLEKYAKRILIMRATIVLAAVVVILGITTAAISAGWMLGRTGFYEAIVVMFFVTLSLTVALTFGVIGQALS